jgi:HEAT repeat protein
MRIAIFLVAVVGGVVCHLTCAAAAEPAFQGKPLTWWFNWWATNREGPLRSFDGPLVRTADLSQCGPAFSEMGPAAVPFIMERLRETSPLQLDYRVAARYFGYIGSNAIPQLVKAVESPNLAVRQAASFALVPYAGNLLSVEESARIFGKTLGDQDGDVILASVEALDKIGSAASNCVPRVIRVLQTSLTDTNKPDSWKWSATAFGTHILASVGPPAANAIPVLTNLLHVPPPVDQLGAAVAIWRINSDTNTILPVLLKWCKFGYLDAMNILGEIGPAAKAAVPFLLYRAKGSDLLQQRSASAALKRIDPEAAAKAGIQ